MANDLIDTRDLSTLASANVYSFDAFAEVVPPPFAPSSTYPSWADSDDYLWSTYGVWVQVK
jgi:hypothetical protein